MLHRHRSIPTGRGRREKVRTRGLRLESLEPRLVLDSTVVFNEIMYHPATAPLLEGDYEWVELFNQMAVNMDVSGWSLRGPINYTFPEGTVISGRSYKVIASNPTALATAGIHSGALGPFADRLPNSGATLQLVNNSGRTMNEVEYGDDGDWPVGPDGSGFSLAKIDAYTSSSEVGNWTTSRQLSGTPGAVNFLGGADAGPGIVLSEISPAATSGFWVEITNQGTTAYQLGGASIVTSAGTGSTYVFPASTLAPGQYLRLNQAQLGFSGAAGDKLYFYSAGMDRLLDARAVDTNLRGLAAGQGSEWLYPSAATPNAANSFNLHEEIVINEIMYNDISMPPATSTTKLLAIDAATQWRYNQTGSNLGTTWAQTAHTVDHTSWYSGAGLLAFEPDSLPMPIRTALRDPLTVNPYVMTTYFETDFIFDGNLSDVSQLLLSHLTDDGAVFYLNGMEVLRYNMPSGSITSSLGASSAVETSMQGPVSIPKNNLRLGTNRLSVEVHQYNNISTDIVFGAELSIATETPYQESDEEWIELYNRSASPLNLAGWSLTKAVEYTFPAGTVIPAGGYLVVAKHAADMRLEYPTLSIVGDYEQSLSNSDDEIFLLAPDKNPADRVRYYDGGYWPSLADGGGSSLELRSPHTDNSKAESWSASNERDKGTWQTYTLTTVATADTGPIYWNEFLFGMLDAGEALIDDVSVISNPGTASATQLIQNGSFQSDSFGSSPQKWRIIGNHHGTIVADPGNALNKVLDLSASGVTTHEGNNAGTTFVGNTAIVNGTVYQISFKARWIGGSTQLNARFYLNRAGKTFILDIPQNTGTPGARNSNYTSNVGPTYSNLIHSPVLPAANQGVVVSVKAVDPNGITSMKLYWSIDGGTWSNTTMLLGTDGLYRGSLPGQAAGTVVQFYARGQDTLGAVSTYPAAGANSRALYQVNDGKGPTTAIDGIRIIMLTAESNDLYVSTNLMSNQDVGATVIYNNKEVFYDAGVRLKGSSASRGNSTWGGSYALQFQPDHLFRGVHSQISLDASGNNPDGTIYQSQAQILVNQILDHGGNGLASNYDDLAYVVVQKSSFVGTTVLQLARYNDEYLDEAYANGSAGNLFEYELIYYHKGTVDGNVESLKTLSGGGGNPGTQLTAIYNLAGTDKDKYRWNLLLKNNKTQDDYCQVVAMAKAFSYSGATFLNAISSVIEVDQWLRTFAVANLMGVEDTFATMVNSSGTWKWPHNMMFYERPEDGKLLMFPWDWDAPFMLSATSGLVWGDSTLPLGKLMASPEYARTYYGHLLDLINTTFNPTYMSVNWVNSFGSLVGQDYSAATSYINSRRSSVLSQLNSAVPPLLFQVATNGGHDFWVTTPTATLAGSGWINVREIRLAGSSEPLDVTWVGQSFWQLKVPLSPGINNIALEAYDFQGNLVATDSIAITSTTTAPQPRDALRITELMYHPSTPPPGGSYDREEFEYVELQNISTSPINLGGIHFTAGITYTFPDVTLQPGEFAIIVENAAAFASRYGSSINIAGQYSGKLSNDGEQLTLLDAYGQTILDFLFDDAWYSDTDGPGRSLSIVDPYASPSNWGMQSAWRSSSYMQGTPGAVDLAPGILVTPTSGLATTEMGDTTQFSVKLASQPQDIVTIGVASSNFQEGVADLPSLTFTPQNWNQPQTITVMGVMDYVADGDTSYTILLLPAVSVDLSYNGMDATDVSITNIDKTRVWDGGGSNDLWNNPQNWANDAVPLPGDLLIFPEGGVRSANTNNFSGNTIFHSIIINGSGYLLGGNALQLVAGITDNATGAADNELAFTSITLFAAQTFQSTNANHRLIVDADVQLAGFPLTWNTNGTIELNGSISGNSGIIKTGSGTLKFAGNNSYNRVTVGEGVLFATSIICDTLTIGTIPGTFANTAAANASEDTVIQRIEMPERSAGFPLATRAVYPAGGLNSSDSATVAVSYMTDKANLVVSKATSPLAVPLIINIPPIIPSVISVGAMEQASNDSSITEVLDQEFVLDAVNSDQSLTSTFDDKQADSYWPYMPERQYDLTYHRLADSLTRTEMQRSFTASPSETARSLAFRSLANDERGSPGIGLEEFELLMVSGRIRPVGIKRFLEPESRHL